MPIVPLLKWKIDADPRATREAYRLRAEGSPEECRCAHCRNFAAARDEIYTPDVQRLLRPLGVELPIREAEIFHTHRLDNGLHLYGGWFHIVGKIVEGADAKRMLNAQAWTYDLEKINDHFSIGPTAQQDLVPPSFRGLPLVQLEFCAEAPWILDEPCN